MTPVLVRTEDWLIWAMPKSTIFTRPSCRRKMLAGLMSRWTMPFWWAKLSPSQTWTMMLSTFFRVKM